MKTLNVSSFVTSSTSIGVPPVLVECVHGANKPHSMSCLYVEPLKNPIVELYNLRSVETLSQSSLNVAGVDNIIDESVLVTPSGTDIFYPLSALSKTVGVGPLKETLTQTYVAPNVTTSLVQPVHIESESASDNEKSQSKMVTANDEEEKALVPSFVGYAMDFLCTYMI